MKVPASEIRRVAEEWQQAFRTAHGKPAPRIVWEVGWFRIYQGQRAARYRRTQIVQMTKVLRKGFDD